MPRRDADETPEQGRHRMHVAGSPGNRECRRDQGARDERAVRTGQNQPCAAARPGHRRAGYALAGCTTAASRAWAEVSLKNPTRSSTPATIAKPDIRPMIVASVTGGAAIA